MIAHSATGEIGCLALQLGKLGERVELLRLVEHGAHNLPQRVLAEFSGAGGTALDLAPGLAGLVGGVCSEALP
jgi:hypothetical protein